jgi:hypothetical protein
MSDKPTFFDNIQRYVRNPTNSKLQLCTTSLCILAGIAKQAMLQLVQIESQQLSTTARS